MMRYIPAKKLIEYIKSRRDGALERQKNLERIGQETVLNEMIAAELNRLISFIASLQQEQPVDIPSDGSGAMGTTPPKFKLEVKEQPVDGLEEEIENYFNGWCNDDEYGQAVMPDCSCASVDDCKDIARHFAEWGAEHLKK